MFNVYYYFNSKLRLLYSVSLDSLPIWQPFYIGGNMKIINKGFTLIELLIVILIIGILAAVALPQYQMSTGKAKYSALKENLQTLRASLGRYYLANHQFTRDLTALDVQITGGMNCYVDGHMKSIWCNMNIFNVLIEYGGGLKRNAIVNPACVAYSKNLNDKANRLCQQETKRKTPNAGTQNYNWYNY